MSGEKRDAGGEQADVVEGWVAELCQHLRACTQSSQLEDIVYDEQQRFAPANLKTAFEALVRICFQKQLPVRVKGGMTNASCEALLSLTPAEDFKNMGAVLLAHALDILQQLKPPQTVAMLQAMALLGIIVDDDIMLDLVRHAVLTLHDCGAQDIVHILVGLAMLEHQPEESSLVALEKHVGMLSSQFDTSAQMSLLWSFSKLGRQDDVNKALATYNAHRTSSQETSNFSRVRSKAMFLHGEELRDTFHPKLWRCPLMMSRRTALPPKHVHQNGASLLALNERPAFSLRFTQPWVAEKMQRAHEHREQVKSESKALLKGKRDKNFRDVRMANMHKRFVAEDGQLIINPDQSEKDQELRDALAQTKAKYQTALKEWRSQDNTQEARLHHLAHQLHARVEHKRADLKQALADKAAGITHTATTNELAASDDAHDEYYSRVAAPKMILAKVMWAHFAQNLFAPAPCRTVDSDAAAAMPPANTTHSHTPSETPQSTPCSETAEHADADTKESDNRSSRHGPQMHYFELYINGKSTCMRTAGKFRRQVLPSCLSSMRTAGQFRRCILGSSLLNPLVSLSGSGGVL